MKLDEPIKRISDKLQHLLNQFLLLKKENEKLRDELQASKLKEAETLGKMAELQQQVSILKLAAGEMSEKDKKVFERQLNQYIREIDKTIAYLSE